MSSSYPERPVNQLASEAMADFPGRLRRLYRCVGGAVHLSHVLNCSPSKLYEWTYRNTDGTLRLPNGHSMVALAVATNVDMNWLLTGRGHPPTPLPEGSPASPTAGADRSE